MENGDIGSSNWTKGWKKDSLFGRFLSVLSIDVLFKLSGIFLLPLYLRLMTQEEYGLYNYILSITANVTILLCLGLYVSQSKYYNDTTIAERKGVMLFNVFLLVTASMVVILVPVYSLKLDYRLIRFFFKNEINYPAYRWTILLAIIVSVYVLMLTNFFVASEKIKHFRRFNLVRLALVNVTALAGLYFFALDKINGRLLYTYLAEGVILLGFSLFWIREMVPRIDGRVMRKSLLLGLPVMLSAICSTVANYSDKYYLEKYGSGVDLSYYYLAFSVANVIYMIYTAMQSAWLPIFLQEKNLRKNMAQTRQMMIRVGLLLLGVSVLLVTGFYVVLVTGIISQAYWPALNILPVLLVAQILSGLLQLYSNYFIYLEKTYWSFVIGLLASGIGISGSYLLIPRWNVFGAVVVFLLVQMAYLLLYYAVISHTIKKRLQKGDDLSHESAREPV